LVMTGIQVAILALLQQGAVDYCGTSGILLDPAQFNFTECLRVRVDTFCAVNCLGTNNSHLTGKEFYRRQMEEGGIAKSEEDATKSNSLTKSAGSNTWSDLERIHAFEPKLIEKPKGMMYCNSLGALVGDLPLCTCYRAPTLNESWKYSHNCYPGTRVYEACNVTCRPPFESVPPFAEYVCGEDGAFVGNMPECRAANSGHRRLT